MIKLFCKAWEKNNNRLRNYISSHEQTTYYDYTSLVKILFDECINPYIEEIMTCKYRTFDTNRITVIDNGDYQGTLLFVIPEDTYQPCVSEYIFTSVYYGSCSYCDTLEGIQDINGNGLPEEGQVNDYMTLLLNILEQCHWFIEREDD